MGKVFTASTTIKSAIDELEQMQKQIENILSKTVDQLIKETEKQLELQLDMRGYGNASFKSDIKINKLSYNSFEIKAEGASVYVELGTGIVGKENPHKDISMYEGTWIYDINNHGEDGWIYYKDGNYYWTKGRIPSGYLLATWEWLVNRSNKVLEENFNKVFGEQK